MQEIGYKEWGLIPYDIDPSSGVLQAPNPPMMSIIALEENFSIVFKLNAIPQSLVIQVEATALSAEGHGDAVLSVYTGSTEDSFRAASATPWEKGFESMYALFQTKVDRPGLYLKLYYGHTTAFVVNKVQFYS
jgi:hypothetical protein